MKKFLWACLLLSSPLLLHAEAELQVVVSGIDADRGKTIVLSLFDGGDAYEKGRAFFQLKGEFSPETLSCTFTVPGLSPGEEYMILGLQDANGNLEMDTGLFGIPREGFFCSGNKKAPDWDNCRFLYDEEDSVMCLDMIYR